MDHNYDFSGWATRHNILCGDGRTILKDAFKDCDGATVPIAWNHQHNDPSTVLGHALLENRDEGVYAYGYFNDTEQGRQAKEYVRHGDITALSIFANHLKQNGKNVLHGTIREVSLVFAGANPGAYIDWVAQHSDDEGEAAIMYISGDDCIEHSGMTKEDIPVKDELEKELTHAEGEAPEEKKEDAPAEKSENADDETVQDVIDSMNDKQKKILYALVEMALKEGKSNTNETDSEESDGGNSVKHNCFNSENVENENVLTHSDLIEAVDDMKRFGSLKESFLQHGIEGIETLFPEAKANSAVPEFIERDKDWVNVVMSGVSKSPFSRIKSLWADITEDEARAKGFFGKTENADGESNKQMLDENGKPYRDNFGNYCRKDGTRVYKTEEVFGLLKRVTQPTTVYKKQKFDRNDIIDITDFDVISWIKKEMRTQLDEELARAYLIGDGRSTASDDKIYEDAIRPIWTDEDLFTIKTRIAVDEDADADTVAKAVIRAAVKSRKDYKGSGNPIFITTEDYLTDMLLMEDSIGRPLYTSQQQLETAMRVSKIVTCPLFENQTRTATFDGNTETRHLVGLIVNLKDYKVGADKGGEVTMFDDFDIDYNQQKYLIETRCSGSLVKPYSAIALELVFEED